MTGNGTEIDFLVIVKMDVNFRVSASVDLVASKLARDECSLENLMLVCLLSGLSMHTYALPHSVCTQI